MSSFQTQVENDELKRRIDDLEHLTRNHNHRGYDLTNKLQNAELHVRQLNQARIERTVNVGENIQVAINEVNALGGGTLLLQAGTHKVTTALTGLSTIQFVGENETTSIIDFNSTSANLSFAGTSVYTTGTITSITGGVNVTGSGTLWLANVTTSQQFFIAGVWYKIAAVLTDTTLTLSEGYQGGATFPGASYRVATIIKDIEFKELTFKSSTGTALAFTDCRNIIFENVTLDSNNVGMSMNNCSEIDWNAGLIVSSTSDGLQMTNCGLLNMSGLSTPSNGGNGVTLNTALTGTFFASSSSANTGDGYNLTSCSGLQLNVKAASNSGQGIELVSGNSVIVIFNHIIQSNTSDGIKLTASSDNCRIIGGDITSNGAYGINIANANCDNNIVLGNYFASNTTAASNNSGTGTLIRSNVGLTDSP